MINKINYLHVFNGSSMMYAWVSLKHVPVQQIAYVNAHVF